MKDFVFQRSAEVEPGRAAADLGTLQRKAVWSPFALNARVLAQRQVMAGLGMPQAPVQRVAADEEEMPVQSKRNPMQRVAVPEEEELPLQARFAGMGAIQRQADAGDEGVAQAKAEEAQGGLPMQLRAGIEALSGMDMSGVRVHRNSSQPAQLNALAYAQGNDIHLGPGQEGHLPHEAWHVVQQRQGRVSKTTQAGGVDINDEPALESEADEMGKQASTAFQGDLGR